jgi:hypothetical protein
MILQLNYLFQLSIVVNFKLIRSWSLNTNPTIICIVFRPGPVQGPGSGFWPGHRVARVNFFKSKRRRFSKKNKSQPVATRFLTESCRVTPSYSFPYFFFNLARFQPRVDPPGRARCQNYDYMSFYPAHILQYKTHVH